MSINSNILTAFQNGAELTKAQITKRFGVRNPSAHVSKLRQAGYPIYNNTRKANNGRVINVYRLGTPKRSTVAAGNIALSDPFYATELRDRIAKTIRTR